MFMFHGTNFWVFMIGAFPVMAISSTMIFLDADWPLRFWAWLKRPTFRAPDPGWMLLGMIVVPIIGAVLGWKIPRRDPPKVPNFLVGRFVPIALSLWMAVQILVGKCDLELGDPAAARAAFERARDLALAQHHEGPLAEVEDLLDGLHP